MWVAWETRRGRHVPGLRPERLPHTIMHRQPYPAQGLDQEHAAYARRTLVNTPRVSLLIQVKSPPSAGLFRLVLEPSKVTQGILAPCSLKINMEPVIDNG